MATRIAKDLAGHLQGGRTGQPQWLPQQLPAAHQAKYDDLVSWLKSVTADPCWESDGTKAIQLLTAERNKFSQSFQQVQRGNWSAAGRSLKQAFKLRRRTIDRYNDSYAWACE